MGHYVGICQLPPSLTSCNGCCHHVKGPVNKNAPSFRSAYPVQKRIQSRVKSGKSTWSFFCLNSSPTNEANNLGFALKNLAFQCILECSMASLALGRSLEDLLMKDLKEAQSPINRRPSIRPKKDWKEVSDGNLEKW